LGFSSEDAAEKTGLEVSSLNMTDDPRLYRKDQLSALDEGVMQ